MNRRRVKQVVYRGITFQSNLEVVMHKLLKKNKVPFSYEKQVFILAEGFHFPNKSYERFLKGSGAFKDRGNKEYKDMKYTPDFTSPKGKPLKWVIEVKGRSFPDFPRKWKLFKRMIVKKKLDTVLFMPRNEKDCVKVVEIIKEGLV